VRALKERHSHLKVKNTSRAYNYELTTYLEVGSMLDCAEATALAAHIRTESRGAHRRADFPRRDDSSWRAHTVVKLVDGSPQVEKAPMAATE
jgi:succinate dehydrogenase / fumarate reductase flavoprotein subunit